ncbi:hypothetical protein Ppa06_57820 [Planomonospora parontospora subsp. parontospora]|uniref:Uncharacterized protein n=2 Tax=Planomonospora parontospora TaxID=58119 RepID=A0AA37F775_9ACTN|nr:hypothetical protein [Planomonospora parontospora]GGK90535.1 hypothetical protein GCM10010126_57490 [Planomonospora parontospora]GII11984.1 hypothetical protein Ppa06_57820 [Planomonospora parontospora subsp. parontospora]
MSGGSYNYLGDRAHARDLVVIPVELEEMARRLADIPGAEAARSATTAVIKQLKGAANIAESLAGVWRAVEWNDSGDGHAGQVPDALAAYAAAHPARAHGEVRPGQVWADRYPGNRGRTIHIDQTDERYAYATVVTNADFTQEHLDADRTSCRDMRGTTTRILLSGVKRGYRLVAAPDQQGSGA